MHKILLSKKKYTNIVKRTKRKNINVGGSPEFYNLDYECLFWNSHLKSFDSLFPLEVNDVYVEEKKKEAELEKEIAALKQKVNLQLQKDDGRLKKLEKDKQNINPIKSAIRRVNGAYRACTDERYWMVGVQAGKSSNSKGNYNNEIINTYQQNNLYLLEPRTSKKNKDFFNNVTSQLKTHAIKYENIFDDLGFFNTCAYGIGTPAWNDAIGLMAKDNDKQFPYFSREISVFYNYVNPINNWVLPNPIMTSRDIILSPEPPENIKNNYKNWCEGLCVCYFLTKNPQYKNDSHKKKNKKTNKHKRGGYSGEHLQEIKQLEEQKKLIDANIAQKKIVNDYQTRKSILESHNALNSLDNSQMLLNNTNTTLLSNTPEDITKLTQELIVTKQSLKNLIQDHAITKGKLENLIVEYMKIKQLLNNLGASSSQNELLNTKHKIDNDDDDDDDDDDDNDDIYVHLIQEMGRPAQRPGGRRYGRK